MALQSSSINLQGGKGITLGSANPQKSSSIAITQPAVSGATIQGSRTQGVQGLSSSLNNLSSNVSTAGGGVAESSADAAKRAAAQAGISNTNKAIDSLEAEKNISYNNINNQKASVLGGYDKEAGRVAEDFNTNLQTNNENYAKNQQNAYIAGAQGASGLRSTLASLGALGGDGNKLLNRAVTQGVQADIGGATDTATTNEQNLNKAYTRFRDEDEDRRNTLNVDAQNQRTQTEGSVEQKRQSYYQDIARMLGEIGDTAGAAQYLNMAGDLNNTIAQKTSVIAAPITARAATYSPDALQSYLTGAGDMTVDVADDGIASSGVSNPNSILVNRKRREALATV